MDGGVIQLRLAHNSGVAFGLGSALPAWVIVTSTATITAVMVTFAWPYAFPCPTWAKLDRFSRGIAREVEKFGYLSDEELHREPYGDDRWDHGAA